MAKTGTTWERHQDYLPFEAALIPPQVRYYRSISLENLAQGIRELTQSSNGAFPVYPDRPYPTGEELSKRLDKLSDAEMIALHLVNDRPFYKVSDPLVRATVAKLISKRPVPPLWQIDALEDSERFVLLAHYGMLDHHDWLITQIAGHMKKSTRTVSIILDRAFKKALGRHDPASNLKGRRAAKVKQG